MATEVYKKETIALQDGTDVLLRPLAIGRLRRFMTAWDGFSKLDENDQDGSLNIFVTCAGIAIEDSFKEQFDKTFVDGELTDEYRSYLEDVLDIETIYKILDVCGNIKLNDPKVQEAMREAVIAAAGTN